MNPAEVGAGCLVGNLTNFARLLRRAGVPVDAQHVAVSIQAAVLVGLSNRDDLGAALEAVLVTRKQDRQVFRDLFDVFVTGTNPGRESLASVDRASPDLLRGRAGDALAAALGRDEPQMAGANENRTERDTSMTASAAQRLRHAEFSSLSASEYQQVERLARGIALPLPVISGRRQLGAERGAELHWPGVLRHAGRNAGEVFELPRLRRRDEMLPLLMLVDISGSMQRYSRLLLAFLHASTRRLKRRDVFAFGTRLTDLTPCFRVADTDDMLLMAAKAVPDFAGGTRLGEALATLRLRHARRLVGGRTVVLIVSDGLDTADPGLLDSELTWLKRHCRRLLWLNPLLRFDGYAPLARGAARLHRHADAMLAVHDLGKLEQLASSLAALVVQPRRR